MKLLHKKIGERLRYIRENVLGDGVKLTASQCATLFNTSADKIRNYESGRSAVPVEFLVKLYRKGINPVFIIAGEGIPIADNKAGWLLNERSAGNVYGRDDEAIVQKFYPREFDTSHLSSVEKLNLIESVAGDIRKKLDEKK